jgi:hypothetical protein
MSKPSPAKWNLSTLKASWLMPRRGSISDPIANDPEVIEATVRLASAEAALRGVGIFLSSTVPLTRSSSIPKGAIKRLFIR